MEPTLAGLRVVEESGGSVESSPERVRLVRPAASRLVYSNAQVGDATGDLCRRAPLRVRLRARFSHPAAALRGTAGFGLWNAALSPSLRRPRLPRAAWFFFSAPPHDVPLALGVPGSGPKAGCIDAARPPFFALVPLAIPGFAAMRVTWLYNRLWPLAQWALGVDEVALKDLDLTSWHDYAVHWRVDQVSFRIDGSTVLTTPRSPEGPLSFIVWYDNAFAIATPRGRFALGTVDAPEAQWLEVEGLAIDRGAESPPRSNQVER
jgi:hypothetical protein